MTNLPIERHALEIPLENSSAPRNRHPFPFVASITFSPQVHFIVVPCAIPRRDPPSQKLTFSVGPPPSHTQPTHHMPRSAGMPAMDTDEAPRVPRGWTSPSAKVCDKGTMGLQGPWWSRPRGRRRRLPSSGGRGGLWIKRSSFGGTAMKSAYCACARGRE
jgi:hypothetical protein